MGRQKTHMAGKLPIGIQDFAGPREGGYAYVDKTEYMHRLAHEGKPYFLSRSRRFGKSLLVSTLRCYFEGRRELFGGLAIEGLEAMDDPGLLERNRAVFKSFFSVLKSADAHLRFVFITGVTKFSKVSVFSDLNQLHDISMSRDFAGICCVTTEELLATFSGKVDALAEAQDSTAWECLTRLADMYDGYRFHPAGPDVYNPFSLANAFADRDPGS